MTLPNLITNYQKQETVARLKKAYTILYQAYRQSVNDDGCCITCGGPNGSGFWNYPRLWFEQKWKPYLKIAKICKTYKDCGYKSDTPFKYANGDKFTKFKIGDSGSISFSNCYTTFITPDGMVFAIGTCHPIQGWPSNTLSFSYDIKIDINGSKGPNQVGRDFFSFAATDVFGESNKVAHITTSYGCNKGSHSTDAPYYCFFKIIQDGWRIKDDYLW